MDYGIYLKAFKRANMGCCYSSVDSSAPSILPRLVQLPSTPSKLFSCIVKFVLYLSMQCEQNNKNKQKEAGFGQYFFKK